MNDKERKIKLLVSECVECKTHDESYAVRKQADALGLRRKDGESYMRWVPVDSRWYANLTEGTGTSIRHIRTPIPATQWLNRHNVFVPGQAVRLNDDPSSVLMRYIGDCVYNDTYGISQLDTLGSKRRRKSEMRGCDPDGNPWPEWRDEPETVTIDWGKVWANGGTGFKEYSQNQAREIRRQIDAQLPRKEQA
jgi:hypothetical protein